MTTSFQKDYPDLWEKFNYVNDIYTRQYIIDGINSIEKLGLVEWFCNFTPKKDEGYVWCMDKNLLNIQDNMELGKEHSGTSMSITMRNLELYYKKGEAEFRESFTKEK